MMIYECRERDDDLAVRMTMMSLGTLVTTTTNHHRSLWRQRLWAVEHSLFCPTLYKDLVQNLAHTSDWENSAQELVDCTLRARHHLKACSKRTVTKMPRT